MSRLREIAIDQYIDHYNRVNININSQQVSVRQLNSQTLMFGNLITSQPAGSQILDLGCGTGKLLYWLSQQANIIPVGVDSSITQVATAKIHLPDLEIVCQDGLQYLREHPNTFAGIFCMDVLEHLPTLDSCLEWLEVVQQALRSQGFFVCRVPNAANLTGLHARYMDLTHERLFTSASLLQLLELSGLQQCQIVPIKASHFSGRMRLWLEYWLHRSLFHLCGRGLERVFTYDICAVGVKH